MRSRTSLCATALAFVAASGIARAYAPSVADLDAAARAVGNRHDIAQRIGESIFSTRWSAQVTQISANQVDSHLIVGIRMWGVKFHRPITRDEFVGEVVSLVERTFAAVPHVEEVDVWASVPIAVPKGVVVSGDLAKPTSRTVFSLTVRGIEPAASLRARASRSSDGVFWDPQWSGTAFKAPS